MNTNIKYLKDEDGMIFSPVTSIRSLYDTDGELFQTKVIDSKELWTGNVKIPSHQSTNSINITLIDDINNYNALYFVDSDRHSMACINNTNRDLSSSREVNGVFLNSTTYLNDRVYFFHFRILFNSSTKALSLFDSTLYTIRNTLNIIGEENYGGTNVNKIYGINFK